MTRVLSFHGRSWHLARHLGCALFVLALRPLSLEARAATAPSEASAQAPSTSLLFTRACDALDPGELDGAATERSAAARASYRALDGAATMRWPLPSLRKAMIESSMSNEVAHMHAFRAPDTSSR